MAQKKKPGSIITPGTADIWPHERVTAKALAQSGYNIEFRISKNKAFIKSPDILIDNTLWEMKSPVSNKLAAVERNLKKAHRQSENIVFDSLRMAKLPDISIRRELIKQFKLTRNIRRLLFVNKKRAVIDIGRLTK